MSLEFGSRKSLEGISSRSETRDSYLDDYRRGQELDRVREAERRKRKSSELFEFGRYGMEGLGKEYDEGIYAAYPSQDNNQSFADSLGDTYKKWAKKTKTVNKDDLKKVDEEIGKLFWKYYDAYVLNDLLKKKEVYAQILFYMRVLDDVNTGFPLSVAKEIEGKSNDHLTVTDDNIRRYDEIMEDMAKKIKSRYKSIKDQEIDFSMQNHEVLKQLETEYEKLLEEYRKAVESNSLEDKLRLMHELKKIQVQEMYIKAGKSREEALQHADSLVFIRSIYLKEMSKFDEIFETRKAVKQSINNLQKIHNNFRNMRLKSRDDSDAYSELNSQVPDNSQTQERDGRDEELISLQANIEQIKIDNPELLNNSTFSYYLGMIEEKMKETNVDLDLIMTYLKKVRIMVDDYRKGVSPDKIKESVLVQTKDVDETNNVEASAKQRADYEAAKKEYEESSASHRLVDDNEKTSKEIDDDLDEFEAEERRILSSKQYSEEQKKEMIERLYSEFDKYTEENPEISGRHL